MNKAKPNNATGIKIEKAPPSIKKAFVIHLREKMPSPAPNENENKAVCFLFVAKFKKHIKKQRPIKMNGKI